MSTDIELAPESAAWTERLPQEKRAAIRALHDLAPARNLVALVFAAMWVGASWMTLEIRPRPARLAGIVVSGAALHALAILMHEAVHGNLFRRRGLDRWAGFLLGAPALFSCAAYRVNHLLHHRHNRTALDPDEFTNLSRNRAVLSAAFYAWPLLGMPVYLFHVPLNALRRGTGHQRRQVLLELFLLAGIYVALVVSAVRLGRMGALLDVWVYPMVAASLLGAVRGWAEHTMTRPGHPLTQSRTVTSNVLVSFLMCNLNYHLEHHLYPAMPWYNLPKLHRLLEEEYRRAGSFIYRSYLRFIWDALRAGIHGSAPSGNRDRRRVVDPATRSRTP
jgi:fatty acid desaturase